MTRRNWVIRAVPAAAMIIAPAIAAKGNATARDRCRWVPRNLTFTASAFWMTKIITTMRATAAAISPVRMPLIRVRGRPGRGACGAAGNGDCGAEPLTEGGGRVLAACGVAGSVMALLSSEIRSDVSAVSWSWV